MVDLERAKRQTHTETILVLTLLWPAGGASIPSRDEPATIVVGDDDDVSYDEGPDPNMQMHALYSSVGDDGDAYDGAYTYPRDAS